MAREDSRDDAFHLAGDRLGKFVVLAELGRGSMGVVYEAFQEDLKRKVALKILPANISLDAKQVRRFHREAESVARLRHDHVIQIYEVGAIDNTHYFAMELVEGHSFGMLHGHDRDTCRNIARIVRDAARGLSHAHERGVVHRDIKPSNLLIDRDGRVVVTDFGLARLTESASLTSTDAIVGTPKYMSPEQILPGTYPLDGRTDVYSLGAAMYEVLAGRPPLEEPSVQAFLRAVIEKRPLSPRKYNREIPFDLATIAMRCLEKDPADRYASAAELADDLDRFLAGDRIVAKPKGFLALAYETVRRHRVITALGAASVLALLVVLFLGGSVSQLEESLSFQKEIQEVRDTADLDAALAAAEDLARTHPNRAEVRKLLEEVHNKRALDALNRTYDEVDFARVIEELEKAGEQGSFWHLIALVEAGRYEDAQRIAEALPEESPLRRLVLARLALRFGDATAALEALAQPPPENAPLELKSFYRLVLGLAYLETGRSQPANEAEAFFRDAKAVLQDAVQRHQQLTQPWLRALILSAGKNAREALGETADLKDLIPDVGLVEQTVGGLGRLLRNATTPEARSLTDFANIVIALAGTEPNTPTQLEREASERLAAAGEDPREIALANLLRAVAGINAGKAQEALDAFALADEQAVLELEPYVYWGQSLIRSVAQNRISEALDNALLAVDFADAKFPHLESLMAYATRLVEQAAESSLADEAEGARERLEPRLEDGPDWASDLLRRVRAAAVPDPPR